ncbi:MAG: hypothetical protein WBN22_01080 [Verrucomicrobiia bacterium]
MRPATKHLLLILGAAIAAYVVVAVYQTVKAGVTDLASLIMSPFTLLGKAWSSITGLASSLTTPSQPASVGVVSSLGVDPNSDVGQVMQSAYDQGVVDAVTGTPVGTGGATLPVTDSGDQPVTGIWSSP